MCRDKIYIAASGVQKERIKSEDLFVLDINEHELFHPPPEKNLKPSQCTPLFFNVCLVCVRGYVRACMRACVHARVLLELMHNGRDTIYPLFASLCCVRAYKNNFACLHFYAGACV